MHGGGAYVSVKGGCLEALNKELLSKATHIWTKSAIVPIPEGFEAYEEEPSSDHNKTSVVYKDEKV